MRVYKYNFPMEDNFELELPTGAVILHVGMMQGSPSIWALVDPDKARKRDEPRIDGMLLVDSERRNFRLAGTGHEINFSEGCTYWGSFIVAEVQIYHLFEGEARDDSLIIS